MRFISISHSVIWLITSNMGHPNPWAYLKLEGQTFNKLTVLAFHHAGKDKCSWFSCLCACGNTCIAKGTRIKSGTAKSCGCAHLDKVKTHWLYWTPAYISWQSMKNRCLRKKNHNYSNYGWRWITICPQWINSFEQFYADMWPRPPGTSLDRKDSNGNYEPSNCQWQTNLWQVINRRVVKPISQFTLDRIFIQSFSCAQEAATITWVDRASISKVAWWKMKTAGWFLWKFTT